MPEHYKWGIFYSLENLTSLIIRNCAICGSSEKSIQRPAYLPPNIDQHTLHSQYTKQGPWWRYQVVRCASCAHYYADPVFKPELLDQGYSIQSHNNEFNQNESFLSSTNAGYAELLQKHLPTRRSLLLDIGCDTGKFIEATERLGFKNRIGIEPSKSSIQKTKSLPNVEFIHGFFSPENFVEQSVDVISMIHVLDHLPNPGEFIRNLRKIVSHDGVVFAVVHNIQSFIARISGSSWHPFNLIHYDYYSKKSLKYLFEKNGFEVVTLEKTFNYISLDQLLTRAPYLGAFMRMLLVRMANRAPLNKIKFKIPLGNIAIIARISVGKS